MSQHSLLTQSIGHIRLGKGSHPFNICVHPQSPRDSTEFLLNHAKTLYRDWQCFGRKFRLQINGVIVSFQYGSRKGHSPGTCALNMINYLYPNRINGHYGFGTSRNVQDFYHKLFFCHKCGLFNVVYYKEGIYKTWKSTFGNFLPTNTFNKEWKHEDIYQEYGVRYVGQNLQEPPAIAATTCRFCVSLIMLQLECCGIKSSLW